MARTTRGHRRRSLTIIVLCLAVAGGGAAVYAARQPDAKAQGTAPSIFKTRSIQRGDLTTTESVDGTLQLSSTLTVLHRIEGQTSSTTSPATSSSTSQSSTSQSSNPASNTASSSLGAFATNAFVDCTAGSVPAAAGSVPAAPEPTTTAVTAAGPATTTTPPPPDSTSPPAADTTSTVDTTTSIDTTTTVETTTPTTAPATPPSTTAAPTEPCDTTTTTTTIQPEAPTGASGSRTFGGPAASTRATSGASATSTTARITQTITSIVAANTTIGRGDVLYTVDGSPVVALDGALPAWRSLSTSADDGADIAQLEASLVAMGYDPDQKVTVDQHFDSATKSMVKAWQAGLGVEATGEVALGSVVFLPSATTVEAVDRVVGDTVGDGDSVLTLAAPSQEVLIDVPAGDEAQVVPGMTVKIGSVDGTVSRLRSANRNGAVVVEAVITPTATIDAAANGSTVKVTLTIDGNTGVLVAPAEALVSRLDGTYAVEAQAADGSTKWITVELLGVSGGNVAIRGDGLDEGATVLLPA